MAELLSADVCVIGAGSGGLSVAAGASQLGARTVLVERARMGGDCLNYGCVPSKALIAAAKHAHAMTEGAAFGVRPVEPAVDFGRVHDHVHEVIRAIEPTDSEARYEGLGCTVIKAEARFTGPRTLEAGGFKIRARRFVIATGSAPSLPPVPGLIEAPHFTNETIFDNKTRPRHLVVLGGGPIGMELAQAHRRLGARVTVLEMFRALGKDDPELTRVVLDRVREEGVDLLEGVRIAGIEGMEGALRVLVQQNGQESTIEGSHLLVAAGRRPNVDGLGLEEAGVAYTDKGIGVDDRLRTSNKRIYAIGDVNGGLQFTHVASHQAGLVIRDALFRLPARMSERAVPWVTYTDPELAHVGATEDEAREAHADIRILRWPFAENDRARAERRTDGLIKVVTTKKGRILGVSIVGDRAGDLVQPWVLAIARKLPISAMAGMIAPYPTLSEASKRAAGAFYTPILFSARMRALVRVIGWLG